MPQPPGSRMGRSDMEVLYQAILSEVLPRLLCSKIQYIPACVDQTDAYLCSQRFAPFTTTHNPISRIRPWNITNVLPLRKWIA
jgi:hypothetical protein